MSASATDPKAKSGPLLGRADEGPWYSVDLDEPGGPGSWGCRAQRATEALAKAERAHGGMNCRAVGARFDELHLENRIPISETRVYRGIPLLAGESNVYYRSSTSNVCYELDPRLDLVNHSPAGFSWGYLGSGPAQLSLALLADVLKNDERAVKLHQPFKAAHVANWPLDLEWWISAGVIRALAKSTERQLAIGLAA